MNAPEETYCALSEGALFFYRGRVALYAALRALGIGSGHEVVLQAYTCLAVPEAIQAAGATPRFVDVEPEGFNMDAAHLAAQVSSRTRAIVVQHTFGIPANLPAIAEVARARGIPLIEDCCHTFASRINGQRVGTFGSAAFYSFEWGKPAVLGLGGSLWINDPDLRQRIESLYAREFREPPWSRQLRLEGQYMAFSALYRPAFYWPLRRAFRLLSAAGAAEGNFHQGDTSVAPDFAWRLAGLLKRRLTSKAGKAAARDSRSVDVARAYADRIRGAAVVHPEVPPGSDVVFARYPLRVTNKTQLLGQAEHRSVEVADWYLTPVHPLTRDECARLDVTTSTCPNAFRRCAETVSLPVNDQVGDRSIDRAAKLFAEIS